MPGRILIVDDIATNRLVLRAKLGARYYDTMEAASGAEAIEIARAEQPDLILLDVMIRVAPMYQSSPNCTKPA